MLYPLAVIATIPAMILAPVIVAEAALLVGRVVKRYWWPAWSSND